MSGAAGMRAAPAAPCPRPATARKPRGTPARMRSGLTEGAYTCRFERDGRTLRVYWTIRGRGQVTLRQGAHRLRHMDGGTAPARAGDRVEFGEEPVLVEYAAK